MRTLLGVLLAASWTFAQAPASQPATGITLTGHVVTGDGRDARPVRRARVTLTGAGAPRIADTDAKGAYRFGRLAAGEFKMAVEKPGFVTLETVATPDATLKMLRGAAIEGIVADASGEPLLNIVVSALQPGADGKPASVRQTRTDDVGRYRLHSLAAGEYWIEAATDRGAVARLVLAAGEKPPGITRAYHPDATALEAARAVRVAAATNTAGIDVTLTPASPIGDPSAPPPPPRPEPTGTGRVAGRITAAETGKPIANARLLLVGVEGTRLTNWKRSNPQGRFEYTNLAARHYTLRVEADRYVSVEYGQTRPDEPGTLIMVDDGARVQVDVTLRRTPAIEGTLVDEFGDPAPGVLVQPARRQFAGGRHRLVPIGSPQAAAMTDDRGQYRLTIPPGEYFVLALAGVFADQNGVGGFAPTYYPGTIDSAAAIAIAAAPAADATASFPLVSARTVSVSGTMVDGALQPGGRGTLWLATADRLKRMDFVIGRGLTAPDGTFVFRNVPPGTYTLQGFGAPPPGSRGPFNLGAMPFGSASVIVADADLDGVVLKVTAGTTLRGKIALEDTAQPPPAARDVRVTALPVEFDSAPVGGGPPPSQTHDDLTFEVTHMSGIRRVLASVSNPRWAVKKITRGGIDITDATVDFREKDVDDVEVVLTSKVSVVSGTVTDDRGRATADFTVVAFAADSAKWFERSRYVAMARPDQQGRFEIRALPPEQYLLVALPTVAQMEWMDPDFLQALRSIATSFTLAEGETKSFTLRLQKRPT